MNIQQYNTQLNDWLAIATVAVTASMKPELLAAACVNAYTTINCLIKGMRSLPALLKQAVCAKTILSSIMMIHTAGFSSVGNVTSTWRDDPE